MFLAFQALYICTTVWDFFLTVAIPNSNRSQIFSALSPTLSVTIILCWLASILILTVILFSYLLKDEYTPVTPTVNIEYSIIIVLYACILIITLFNPIILWPLVLNYIVNIIWGITLICFRKAIQNVADLEAE